MSYDDTVDTYTTEDGEYRIRIVPDLDPSPRDGDNGAVFVSTHRRYDFGDRMADPDEEAALDRGGWRLLKRYLQLSRHAVAITLIGMYDHSGITIYAMDEPNAFRGVDTQWDHSTAGFAYVTREKAAEIGTDDPKALMLGELKDLDDCLTGNVYGFLVEKRETWRKDSSPDETKVGWEVIESCLGFIGEPEYCMAEAKATLASVIATTKKEVSRI